MASGYFRKKLFLALLLFLGGLGAVPDGSYADEDCPNPYQDVPYVCIHCHLLSFEHYYYTYIDRFNASYFTHQLQKIPQQ